jgi:hypothetical protein
MEKKQPEIKKSNTPAQKPHHQQEKNPNKAPAKK